MRSTRERVQSTSIFPFAVAVATVASSLLLSSSLFAQDVEAAKTGASSESLALSPSELRKEAMTQYVVGDVDQALDKLKLALTHCIDAGEEQCPSETRSFLYLDLGIILAGGKSDHAAGVRSFRRALKEQSALAIPEEYRSAEVDAAFAEAKGEPPVATAAVVPPANEGSTQSNWQTEEDNAALSTMNDSPQSGVRALVVIQAMGEGGPAFAFGEVFGLVGFGAQAIVGGVLPSGFTFAGRARGGYLHAPAFGSGIGRWGLGASFGGTMNQESNAPSYILGGMGFDQFPSGNAIGVNLHLLFGKSFNGLGIGSGLDMTIGGGEVDLVFSFQFGFADVL